MLCFKLYLRAIEPWDQKKVTEHIRFLNGVMEECAQSQALYKWIRFNSILQRNLKNGKEVVLHPNLRKTCKLMFIKTSFWQPEVS